MTTRFRVVPPVPNLLINSFKHEGPRSALWAKEALQEHKINPWIILPDAEKQPSPALGQGIIHVFCHKEHYSDEVVPLSHKQQVTKEQIGQLTCCLDK